jgi:hypothetical protein
MGRGAGFRDFLRSPSAKENRSNRRTLPTSSHKVDLSNFGEVRKSGPANQCRPFPCVFAHRLFRSWFIWLPWCGHSSATSSWFSLFALSGAVPASR